MVDCKKCVNSGCCKLKIEVSKQEYNSLSSKVKKEFTKHIDSFLEKSPHLKGFIEKDLEVLYEGNYARMNKDKDGYCPLLDRETMLCSVYEERPKICKDYSNDRCSAIRILEKINKTNYEV
jgi:Fe-S-cluster containining protein